MKNDNQINFPEGFFWGAATSSHQVEGNNHNDWSEWEKSEKRISYLRTQGLIEKYGLENFISGKACDHYNRFQEDFNITKSLGHNAHRFSIEWSRIEPEEGKFDDGEIEHYRQVLRALRDRRLEPFVTLWHFTLPVWFSRKGGFKNKNSPEIFARYCGYVVEKLGDMAQFWVTINEPEIYAKESYLIGAWPPQKKSDSAAYTVTHDLIKGHKKAYKIIKRYYPHAKIGIAQNITWTEMSEDTAIQKKEKQKRDRESNWYFLDAIRNHQDFVGVNHYYHQKLGGNENRILSDRGDELYPEAIYHAVMETYERYRKPIIITENGLADAEDTRRGWFIFETLKWVHKAIEQGADVKGYFHWSLMDNVELDKGFWPRFGLLEIDRKTLERKIRPSANFYRDVCLANGITADIVSKYQNLLEL